MKNGKSVWVKIAMLAIISGAKLPNGQYWFNDGIGSTFTTNDLLRMSLSEIQPNGVK